MQMHSVCQSVHSLLAFASGNRLVLTFERGKYQQMSRCLKDNGSHLSYCRYQTHVQETYRGVSERERWSRGTPSLRREVVNSNES